MRTLPPASLRLRSSALVLGLVALAATGCSEDEQSLADATAQVGAAGKTGAGSTSGAGNTTGAGSTTGAGNTTGAGSTTGAGNTTGAGSTTGAGNATGAGSTSGAGASSSGSGGSTASGGASASGGHTGAGAASGTSGAGNAAGAPGEEPSPQCPGPQLLGCSADADCGEGSICENDPSTCHPSACTCVDGVWGCTKDCLGGVCVPKGTGPKECKTPSPQGCSADADCAAGSVCKDLDDGCHASSCQCNDGVWGCTKDCLPGSCVAADTGPKECKTPNPQGCKADADCGKGSVCTDLDDGCHASSCQCNDGVWGCTKDCLPGSCVPEDTSTCKTPNPEGCTADADCGKNEFCAADPETCRSSNCLCSDGFWVCNKDCTGGVCKTKAP